MALNVDFLRQIHPTYIYNKVVSGQAFDAEIDMQAFIPTTKDNGKLSLYDGGRFSAQESFEHYTTKLKSGGVLGISVNECDIEELPYTYDTEPFEGHCSLDFNGKTKSQKRLCAISLRDYAVERGWLYRPE